MQNIYVVKKNNTCVLIALFVHAQKCTCRIEIDEKCKYIHITCINVMVWVTGSLSQCFKNRRGSRLWAWKRGRLFTNRQWMLIIIFINVFFSFVHGSTGRTTTIMLYYSVRMAEWVHRQPSGRGLRRYPRELILHRHDPGPWPFQMRAVIIVDFVWSRSPF